MRTLIICIVAFAAFCSARVSAQYHVTPAGLIKGARFEYVSDTSIKVGVGYGDILGAYWEISPADAIAATGYTLSGLTNSTNGVFHYVYIDRSACSLPKVTLRNSTTAPSWSADFLGWYDGDDRCIGVVWVKSDGTLAEFECSEDNTFIVSGYEFVNNGPISTTNAYTSINVSGFIPVNAYEARMDLMAFWNNSGSGWSWVTVGMGFGNSTKDYAVGTTRAQLVSWIPIKRGTTTLYWKAWASHNTGTSWFTVRGYRIER